MPVGLPWGGYVDTDINVQEFFDTDHTVSVYVMPQYPYTHSGPYITTRNVDWFSIGQGTYTAEHGKCPHGGRHLPPGDPSGVYVLDVERTHAKHQGGWLRCNDCGGLFFGGDGLGVCAAGGTHNPTGSPQYRLLLNATAADLGGGFGDPGWRWCQKCQALFSPVASFAPIPAADIRCPAGGAHDGSASGTYMLRRPPVDSEVGRQAHWLSCSNCQMLHFGGRHTCVQVGLGGLPPGPIAVTMRRRAWHHVAVVRASNLFNLYVDGRNIGELPSTSSGPVPSASLRLGRVVPSKTAGMDQFYGLLDDLAIFKRALSQSEISALAAKATPLTGKEPGLLAGLPLSSGTFQPPLNRPITLGGDAVLVGGNGPRDNLADSNLFPVVAPLVPLKLPFVAGQIWECNQGIDDPAGTHCGTGSFCHDFYRPENNGGATAGTHYVAPAPGIVIESTFSARGLPGAKIPNFFGMQTSHEVLWGTQHHQYDGGLVDIGEVVVAGEEIAIAGNTGTGSNHMHAVTYARTDVTVGATIYSDYEVSINRGGTWTHVTQGIPSLSEWVRNPVPIGTQQGWRWCRRCEALYYAFDPSADVCPAGGRHDPAASGAYRLQFGSAGQSGWRWCRRCGALFFAFSGSRCPATTQAHDGSSSFDYVLVPKGMGGQLDWSWCHRCSTLFHGNVKAGVCPQGGLHDPSHSFDYSINFNDTGRPFVQEDWRMCQHCLLMYRGPGNAGVCPAGGTHSVHIPPKRYELLHSVPNATGEAFWRQCIKCAALHHTLNGTGDCAAGGGHDYAGDSPNITLIINSNRPGQKQWRRCAKCRGLFFGPGAAGVCKSGGTHDPSGSFTYQFDPRSNLD